MGRDYLVMISGKLFVVIFVGFMSVMVGGFFYVISNSKGREHNRNEQMRELAKQECLSKMQKYIEEMKEKKQPVKIERLNEFCDEFEFYYFPDNFLDMRKILVSSTAENMIQLKSFKGELQPKSTSMGYFVMYGGDFKIRDVEREKFISKFRIGQNLIDPEAETLINKLFEDKKIIESEVKILKDQFSSSYKKENDEINKIIKRLLDQKVISESETSLLHSQFPLVDEGEFGTKINPVILKMYENKIFLLKKNKVKPEKQMHSNQ